MEELSNNYKTFANYLIRILQLVERSTATMGTTKTWYFVIFEWEFIIISYFLIYSDWLLTIYDYFFLPIDLNYLGIAIRLQLKNILLKDIQGHIWF